MNDFINFDPLQVAVEEVDEGRQLLRTKRSIHAILHSYVSWYDPFAELIQNALDSVDDRAESGDDFTKRVSIVIDQQSNQIAVSDNGVGLEEMAFKRFLAPNESFKDGGERGSKGVGATFLAYGYNYIRIHSKTKHFTASGEMENARRWLHSTSTASNPQVFPSKQPSIDPLFEEFDSGVSINIRFDKDTKPSDLGWPQIKSAKSWLSVLKVKTALGAVYADPDVKISIRVVFPDGKVDELVDVGTGYLAPHELMKRVLSYENIIEQIEKLTKEKGAGITLPARLKNLEAVYVDWDQNAILGNLSKLSPTQKEFIKSHDARIIASYMYGAGVWDRLAKDVGYRRNASVLGPGIQMAADNMPQGELIQIPLTRYTGRQNQAHVLVHFKDCVVDYGRKGFDKDFVDIAKALATSVVQDTFSKVRDCLRTEDVKAKSLLLGDKVATWKKGLEQREEESPLILENENFFLPINEISVTSEPSREQDVIALFNQLVAGGVIRGIKIVGTHEMMTYDGAYRIRVGPNYDDHTFDDTTNPLGVPATSLEEFKEAKPEGFISTELKVLEYKYSIDGLITDITTGDKKAADIDLLIAWEAGTNYTKYFELRSYLVEDGRENREYHGVTHGLFDEHGHHVMDAILLKDLISFLNDPVEEMKHQAGYENA